MSDVCSTQRMLLLRQDAYSSKGRFVDLHEHVAGNATIRNILRILPDLLQFANMQKY